MQIAIEGLDRLGKDTLINNIIASVWYHSVIHYSKPIFPNSYSKDKTTALREYQIDSFTNGFDICMSGGNVIFNRFHLGEYVYAHRYRNYSGKYIFDIEAQYPTVCKNLNLILLYTDNFDIMQDDGLSFDFSKRSEEMVDFTNAFENSQIVNKRMINVHDGNGGYKSRDTILQEALTFLSRSV